MRTVLILQRFAREAGARQWISIDAAAEWMSGAGGSPTASSAGSST